MKTKQILDEQTISTIKSSPIIVVADVETTGLSPEKGASLLEIGAVMLDVEKKKILGKFSEFIRPIFSNGIVPPKITTITGIKTSDVFSAPEQEIVMNQFYQFVGNLPLCFHNAPFDWRFLKKAFLGIGINPTNEILDTLAISKILHPELSKHTLDSLTDFYGCPIKGHHRAFVDAKYTASLYLKMREEIMEAYPLGLIGNVRLSTKIISYNSSCLHVLNVRFWQKDSRRRIYVKTTPAVFCYDLNRSVWFVSELFLAFPVSLDCAACVREILLRLQIADMDEFLQKYVPHGS